jgi:hypothetical protein
MSPPKNKNKNQGQHSARSHRSLLEALGRVNVFQLLSAAHANEGDCPKFLLPFTTLDVTYHIPKFRHNPITLISARKFTFKPMMAIPRLMAKE